VSELVTTLSRDADRVVDSGGPMYIRWGRPDPSLMIRLHGHTKKIRDKI